MITSHFVIILLMILFLLKIFFYIFLLKIYKKETVIDKEGISIEKIRQSWLNKFENEKCVECEKCKHEVLFILSELDDAIRVKEKLAKYCISKLQLGDQNKCLKFQ